jgi:hypothetical protein
MCRGEKTCRVFLEFEDLPEVEETGQVSFARGEGLRAGEKTCPVSFASRGSRIRRDRTGFFAGIVVYMILDRIDPGLS